jgi:hypothetical protein
MRGMHREMVRFYADENKIIYIKPDRSDHLDFFIPGLGV